MKATPDLQCLRIKEKIWYSKYFNIDCFEIFIFRLVSAFSYYGIVLLTTELFETPDGCHGKRSEVSKSLHCG